MKSNEKLLKLQKQIKMLERQEMQTKGSLITLTKSLGKSLSLNNENLILDDLIVAANKKIAELKKKIKKSEKLFNEKMNQIREMTDILED